MEVADNNDAEDFAISSPFLDQRILSIVKQCPNRTIRPARLASELGISVNDACAELCGLLSAVGRTASFVFEEVGSSRSDNGSAVKEFVMVFTFPPDFERRAWNSRRREDSKQLFISAFYGFMKVIKIFVAFGLILSLTILSIAVILSMIAVIAAVSRGGNDHHRNALTRRLRSMVGFMRQALWCYAVFGSHFEGQDSFFSETAGDLALVLSVCCGNPMNIWFWMRASQLSRRRRRAGRGWGGRQLFGGEERDNTEGVALVRQDTWGQQGTDENDHGAAARGFRRQSNSNLMSSHEDQYRGLLSMLVEFLFGPEPLFPGPLDNEKWKMRGDAIIVKAMEQKSVSLEEMIPFCDRPPTSLQDEPAVVKEGLKTVAHFNGRPAPDTSENGAKARFMFPELMAEAEDGVNIDLQGKDDPTDSNWRSILYIDDSIPNGHLRHRNSDIVPDLSSAPPHLVEHQHVLTKLQSGQFRQCLLLGVLNLVGVFWFRETVLQGGLSEFRLGPFLSAIKLILSILLFYAWLFFVLPAARLLVILGLNFFLNRRNERRCQSAVELSSRV